MGGFADYEQPGKGWLPNLISMLLWSSANLPDSRLCVPRGQSAPDWCCRRCGFGLSAAVAGHYELARRASERRAEPLSSAGVI